MLGFDEPLDLGKAALALLREVGDTIYLSGQLPLNDEGYFVRGDVGVQTERVLSNMKALLESVGSSMDEVVKVNVYLTDVKRDFGPMNASYAKFFPAEPKPTRTTVGAELAVDILVEIEAIAVRGSA